MPTKKRFKAILKSVSGAEAAAIDIPFDVEKAFGSRARTPVRVTINGFEFRTSIFPRGGGAFYMVINQTMRTGGRVKAGDKAEFVLERDDAPRTLTVPPDLTRALKGSVTAKKLWDELSYSNRREWITYIVDAKRPETRARRIAKAVRDVAQGKVEP